MIREKFIDIHEESESDKDATGCSNGDGNPQKLLGDDELTMNSLVEDQLRNKNGKGKWDSCSDEHGEFIHKIERKMTSSNHVIWFPPTYNKLAAWSNSSQDLLNARRNLFSLVKMQFDRLRLIWKNILITSKSTRWKKFPGQCSKYTISRFRAPKPSNWASKLHKCFKKAVS